METPSAGSVVLVRFPFSDLSGAKLRPALVLAPAGRGDFVLCQITGNPYSDPLAFELSEDGFESGSLQKISYVRPGKLFTASRNIMAREVGIIKTEVLAEIVEGVIGILRSETMPD